MINLTEIEKFYPENILPFKRSMLREYLQYKILELIFSSDYAEKLSFLGGTALRIVHGNTRFSEDIDFDNFDLSIADFENISQFIKKGLELEGYQVEIRNIYKGAYHCHIKLPRLLFDNNLSGLEEEKILIQMDTMPQNFKYKPEIYKLDKFDVFTDIFTTPKSILLSQKFYATSDRKTPKGRDFFDIAFLLRDTKPNYQFLKAKMNIENAKELQKVMLKFCKELDFEALGKDVSRFLINPKEIDRVLSFPDFIKTKLKE